MLEGFVYIIESPSADDLLSDQVEGRALCSALHLARIPHVYSLTSDLQTLQTALGPRLVQTLQEPAIQGRRPILHLSMHGNDSGVGLTSGEFLYWEELETELQPLMNFMRGGLLITMSSCFGLAGCRMAMNSTTNQPFWALVGHSGSVDWSDAAVAYITFYHQFFKETPLQAAVELMRMASGDARFLCLEGHALKASWMQSVAGIVPPTAPVFSPVPGLLSPLAGSPSAA
jgi:hypothetical protein